VERANGLRRIIQVNYLGNPGTTAAEFFDYILADRIVIPGV
jgi:protein O-GlcNAc transferase